MQSLRGKNPKNQPRSMLGLVLLLCVLLSPVLAAGEDPVARWYGEQRITEMPFFRPELLSTGKLPYTTVRDLWRQSQAKPNERPPTSEWQIPVSTLYASQETARRIRRAWQRLEERYYWYTMSRLALPNPIPCLVSSDQLKPGLPEVRVSLLDEFLPPGHKPGVDRVPVAAAGETRLDSYTYYWLQFASVNPSDFCDGLYQSVLDLIPAFYPTTCVRIPLLGDKCVGPTYLDGLGNARIQSGIERLAKVFIPDYERDILEALAPRVNGGPLNQDYFNPTLWSGALLGGGTVLTPVIEVGPNAITNAGKSLQEIVDLINSAQFSDDKLNAARWPYFYRGVSEAARRISLVLPNLPSVPATDTALAALNEGEYRNPSVRGIWPLEEIKRRFPPSTYQLQESLGYTSYFQAFGRMEATVLPDPNARWGNGEYPGIAFMRSLHFWDVPIIFGLCPNTNFVCEVKTPRPYMVPPYILPYAGPRYLWDWVSIPEGYPIPRVEGLPTSPLPVQR